MAWFRQITIIAVLASLAQSCGESVCIDQHWPNATKQAQVVSLDLSLADSILSSDDSDEEDDCDHCAFCNGSLSLSDRFELAGFLSVIEPFRTTVLGTSSSSPAATFRPPRA